MKKRRGLRDWTFRTSGFVDRPFGRSMSLSVQWDTLFALAKLEGIALMSFIGLSMLNLILR